MKSIKHEKKRGVATIVALVVLVIVSIAAMIFTKTILREKQILSREYHLMQADRLLDDLLRVSTQENKPVELVVPASLIGEARNLRVSVARSDEADSTEKEVLTAEWIDAETLEREILLRKTNDKTAVIK